MRYANLQVSQPLFSDGCTVSAASYAALLGGSFDAHGTTEIPIEQVLDNLLSLSATATEPADISRLLEAGRQLKNKTSLHTLLELVIKQMLANAQGKKGGIPGKKLATSTAEAQSLLLEFFATPKDTAKTVLYTATELTYLLRALTPKAAPYSLKMIGRALKTIGFERRGTRRGKQVVYAYCVEPLFNPSTLAMTSFSGPF